MSARNKPEPISFSEFGPRFVAQILDIATVESWLRQMIGDDPIHFEDMLAVGTAVPRLGQITRKARDCAVTFDVPLALELAFTISLLAESYKGLANLHLCLKAEFYEPAFLFLKVRRINEQDIQIAPEVAEGWGLAQKLGSRWDLVNRAVRAKIKSEINTRLRATRSARLIDLSTLTVETTSRESNPQPAIHDGDKISLVPSDVAVSGMLEPGQVHTFAIALGAGERVKFLVYTATEQDGVTARGRFEVQSVRQTDPAGEVKAKGFAITTEGAWSGDYRRHEIDWQAEQGGIYHVRLENHERPPQRSFHYTVRQERTKPELGDPVCFSVIGPRLIRQIVSPAILHRKVKALIPSTCHFGPLLLLPLTSAEGDAEIAVLSVRMGRPRKSLADRELPYEVVLRVAPDVRIGVLGLAEKWHIETRVTLCLRVHVLAPPLSIQIDPDEVTLSVIQVKEARCLEGSGHFNDLNLLTRNIAQRLIDEIKGLLDQTEAERVIRVDNLVIQATEMRKPALSNAAKPIIRRQPMLKTVGGRIAAGQVPRYISLRLRKGQTLTLHLSWFLSMRPIHSFEASLAVCDEFRGVLKARHFAVGEAGKSGSAKLSFTASQSATHLFRVRIEPSKRGMRAELEYQLKVHAT